MTKSSLQGVAPGEHARCRLLGESELERSEPRMLECRGSSRKRWKTPRTVGWNAKKLRIWKVTTLPESKSHQEQEERVKSDLLLFFKMETALLFL